jgi:hypothetical protein
MGAFESLKIFKSIETGENEDIGGEKERERRKT